MINIPNNQNKVTKLTLNDQINIINFITLGSRNLCKNKHFNEYTLIECQSSNNNGVNIKIQPCFTVKCLQILRKSCINTNHNRKSRNADKN